MTGGAKVPHSQLSGGSGAAALCQLIRRQRGGEEAARDA